MNRMGRLVPLKAAVCLLLCILAAGLICPAALAEEPAASAQAEKTNTLIIVPLRNKNFSEADPNNTVMNELFYALHILRYSDTQISLVPLLASDHDHAAATPALDISAESADEYKGTFTGPTFYFDVVDIQNGVEKTLDTVIGLATQPDRHSVVILIQTKAYDLKWQKLKELLQSTDADVLLIYLDNESLSTDIDTLLLELGIDIKSISQEFNTPVTLLPHMQFIVFTQDRLASSYDALEPVLLRISKQAQLPLTESETESNVTLPELGVSNVMLVLRNIPEDYDVQIIDQKGITVSPVQQYRDSSGRRILELPDVGGKLTITAYGAASAQPTVTGAADTPTPVPADDPQASALPPDGAEATVLPAVSPTPAAQAAAGQGVEGTILFNFQCEDTVLLSTQDGQPSYRKKTPVVFSVQPQGNILPDVLRSYLGVSGRLYVTDQDARQVSYPLSVADGQAELKGQFTPEKAGVYTVEAELQIGDFYTVPSNQIMLDIENQAPIPGDAPAVEYWIDNPYQPDAPITLDLTTLFSDSDLDFLTYSVSSDANDDFQTDWTDEQFAQFSIQGNILKVAPSVQTGSSDITIKATDEDGDFAVSAVQITLHSIYDALAAISIADALGFSENIAKNAKVTITATPQYLPEVMEHSEIVSTFTDNAIVTCILQPTDTGTDISLKMAYDEDSKTYQTVYTMPDTAAQYQVFVNTEFILPEGDTLHLPISGTTNPVPLGSENTAPQWIAENVDLGKQWIVDNGNGEVYDLKRDFATCFSDAEDAMPGMKSHLALYLSVEDSAGRAYDFSMTEEGAYLLTRREITAPAIEPLALPNASSVTLRFQNEGIYTLKLTAEDPDGQVAEGYLKLCLKSETLSLYRTIGLAFAAFVLLLGLCLLIARLLKPAFGEQTLQVSLRTQADAMTWSVPLEAWRKRNVPLRWLLLYGCVPPIPSLDPIASAVTIKPKRDGIQIVTKNDSFLWFSGGESLPRKFIQTELNPPVTLKDSDITLVLSLQNVSQRLIK